MHNSLESVNTHTWWGVRHQAVSCCTKRLHHQQETWQAIAACGHSWLQEGGNKVTKAARCGCFVTHTMHLLFYSHAKTHPAVTTAAVATSSRRFMTAADALSDQAHLKRLTPVPGSLSDFSNMLSASDHLYTDSAASSTTRQAQRDTPQRRRVWACMMRTCIAFSPTLLRHHQSAQQQQHSAAPTG